MTSRLSRPRAAVLLLAGLTLLNDLHAAETDAAHACSSIGGDAARLACYDAAFGRPSPAPTGAPADQFGDNGQLTRSVRAKAAIPKTLNAQIVEVGTLPNGLYRLALDNQQTWQTTEASWALDFKIGQRVTLTRMSLGGYQLSPDGSTRSVGARRLQ